MPNYMQQPFEQLSDEALVGANSIDRSEEAFGVLYNRYELEVLRYLRKFIHDDAEVKDLFQDLWLKFWSQPSVLASGGHSVESCRYAQMRFAVLDSFRNNKKWKLVPIDALNMEFTDMLGVEHSAYTYVEGKELVDIVEDFIGEYEGNAGLIFLMRLQNYSVQSISELLDVSERWVYNAFSKTRKRFEEHLREHH